MTGLLALSLPASESAQTAEHSSSILVVLLAVVIFVGTYVLIAAEWVHRVAAALLGAALIVVIGVTNAESAFFSENTAVDWNVVFLLLGMMIIIGVLKQTGLFEYLAIWAAKRAWIASSKSGVMTEGHAPPCFQVTSLAPGICLARATAPSYGSGADPRRPARLWRMR